MIWVHSRLAESGALLLSAQVTEVAAVRKGLLGLRQNVLLLQDDADPDKFYPRCVPPQGGPELLLAVLCARAAPCTSTAFLT